MAPRRYVQREGLLLEAGDYLNVFGRHPLILGDGLVLSIIRPTLEDQLPRTDLSPSFIVFREECSHVEVQRITEIARRKTVDFIVGTGGGKAIDTSRLVADRLRIPLITLPTSAATCSAAASVSVIYEKGVRQQTVSAKGADLVLVDSAIVSKAPTRMLSAGMADALSKWYEGKCSYEQAREHDSTTQTAMNLSAQVKETILSIGLEAKRDVEAKRNSLSVETIITANILLTGIISGLGGPSFRTAVAHGLLYGMTVFPQVHQNLHGEIVAFGIIVQLCLEKSEGELRMLIPFFSQLGLPLTLEELGLINLENSLFWEGLRRASAKGSSVHNMPFPVDEKKLYHAILKAEKWTKCLKENRVPR